MNLSKAERPVCCPVRTTLAPLVDVTFTAGDRLLVEGGRRQVHSTFLRLPEACFSDRARQTSSLSIPNSWDQAGPGEPGLRPAKREDRLSPPDAARKPGSAGHIPFPARPLGNALGHALTTNNSSDMRGTRAA